MQILPNLLKGKKASNVCKFSVSLPIYNHLSMFFCSLVKKKREVLFLSALLFLFYLFRSWRKSMWLLKVSNGT